jgi:ethanolamine utilization protein EutQ (cupin superfamily)
LLLQESKDGRRFATGEDDAVQSGKLIGLAHLDRLGAGFGEGVSVGA